MCWVVVSLGSLSLRCKCDMTFARRVLNSDFSMPGCIWLPELNSQGWLYGVGWLKFSKLIELVCFNLAVCLQSLVNFNMLF